MRKQRTRLWLRWYLYLGIFMLPIGLLRASQGTNLAPTYKVDPFWAKPLPSPADAQGRIHPWVTGAPGATCVDSHDHIITVNRGFLKGGLGAFEGVESGAIPAPPVVLFDPQGNMVSSWGDPALTPEGATRSMPQFPHGCFADYEDNIWIGGTLDGVVQKWSHDGKMLLQIGTKGVCDGAPTLSPKVVNPTCADGGRQEPEPGFNSSRTLLNGPADIAVDPNPDPVTKERGSVYIADGYGNHRVVVFDAKGKYLRQWGSAGSGAGEFVKRGGGHPHCIVLANDGLVYTCDRGQSRIQVFDKLGTLKQMIPFEPPGLKEGSGFISDIAFSHDPEQTWLFMADLGTSRIWILERASGKVVGSMGRPGHMAGEFVGAHTLATDSKDNLYISETVGGRRTQKFVRVTE